MVFSCLAKPLGSGALCPLSRRRHGVVGPSAIGEECTPRIVRDRRLDNEQKSDTSTSDMHADTSEY